MPEPTPPARAPGPEPHASPDGSPGTVSPAGSRAHASPDASSVHARALALRVYYFCSFSMLGAYLPYFPSWLEAQGVDGLAIGVIASAMPAMNVLGPPAFGALADRLGLRGGILRLSCAGALVGFAAITALSRDAALPFAALLVLVSFFAFFRSPMVLLADVVALELADVTRAPSYGALRLWGSIGFLVTAAAVGRWIDPRTLLLPAAVAVLLAAALVAAFFLPSRVALPAPPAPGEVRALLSARGFQLFLLAAFLGQGAQSVYDLCFSRHLRDLGAGGTLVGAAWAVGVAAEVALLAGSARLLSRFGAPRLLVVAFAGAAVRWLLIAALRSPWLLLLLQPLHALSFALMWVASLGLVKAHAGPRALASAQGVATASAAAGMVLAMPLWGALYRHGGGALAFGTAAAFSLAAALVALRLPATRPAVAAR
ncbi:MAG: MFS transporter [Polyangiaceae bacterium]